MDICVDAVVNLDGDEDPLISAVTWLLRKEYLKKAEKLDFLDVTVESANDWIEYLFDRYTFRHPEIIEGKIELSYSLAKKLKLDPDQKIIFS